MQWNLQYRDLDASGTIWISETSEACLLDTREGLHSCVIQNLLPRTFYQVRVKEVCKHSIRNSDFVYSTSMQTWHDLAGKPLDVRTGLSAYTADGTSDVKITKIEKTIVFNLRLHIEGTHDLTRGSRVVVENVANTNVYKVERASKIGVETLCFEGINVLARSSTSLTIKTSFCPSTLTGTRRCMALISGEIEPAGSKIHAGIDHQDSTVITVSPLSTSNTHIINGLASLKIYDVRCAISTGNSDFKVTSNEQIVIPRANSISIPLRIDTLTSYSVILETIFTSAGNARCVVVAAGTTSGITASQINGGSTSSAGDPSATSATSGSRLLSQIYCRNFPMGIR